MLGARSHHAPATSDTAVRAIHARARASPGLNAARIRDTRRRAEMSEPSHTARSPLRLKEMTPSQVARLVADDPRLIIPVGTCEQHGPHLPIGCATIIAEHLADDLSADYGVIR